MKIPEMAKIVYRQMPAPRELPQQMPAPWAKARMQKPQGGGKFLVQIPGSARGRVVMDEIDTCINTAIMHGFVLSFLKTVKKIFVNMESQGVPESLC